MPNRATPSFLLMLALLKRAFLWFSAGCFLVGVPLLSYFLWLIRGVAFEPVLARRAEPDPRTRNLSARFAVDDAGRIYPRSDLPGFAVPPIRAAADAGLAADDEIIGVLVGGRSRAYLVRALVFPWHVVNDVIGGQAVSVTYCDRARCMRVFTKESANKPLQLDIAGQMESGLILRIGNVEYSQKTGENLTSPKDAPLPYSDMQFARTTWRQWREAHPDTDVYIGDLPPQRKADASPVGE